MTLDQQQQPQQVQQQQQRQRRSFALKEPPPPLLQTVTALVLVLFLGGVVVWSRVAHESIPALVWLVVPLVVAPVVPAFARRLRLRPGPLVVDVDVDEAGGAVIRYPAIGGMPAVDFRADDVNVAFAGRAGLVVTAADQVRVLPRGSFVDKRELPAALDAVLDAVGPLRRGDVAARGAQLKSVNEARPWAVYASLALTGVMFAVELVVERGGGVPALLELGAAQRNAIFDDGQVWRFFTAAFMHLNVLHLFMNGTSLFAVGPVLERWLSRQALFVILVVSALAGTALSIGMQSGATLGLSGGIFGLLGALLASTLRYRRRPLLGPRLPLRSWIVLLVTNGILSSIPGVDWRAHAGGFVAGALLCLVLAPRLTGKGDQLQRKPALLRGRAVIIVAAALAAATVASVAWAIAWAIVLTA